MEPVVTPRIDTPQSSVGNSSGNIFSWKNLLAIMGIVVALFIIWQWISSPMVVMVYGEGKVSVPATSATINATVSVNSDTPQNAISAVKAKADILKSILVSGGAPMEKISESQITSYPANLVATGASGYQAAIVLTAETLEVSNANDLVASLYIAGASLVQQPVLNVENKEKLEDQAVKLAMKDANSQASKIGLSRFKFIRKIVDLYEVDSSTTSTSTSGTNTETANNGVFEVVKTISASYKLW